MNFMAVFCSVNRPERFKCFANHLRAVQSEWKDLVDF